MITGSCDSCGYFTELKVSKSGPPDSREALLCAICRNTLIGNAYFYPTQYEHSTIFKTLGWIANMLRDEIRKK